MTVDAKNLRERASAALNVLHHVERALGSLALIGSERSATTIPLILASIDIAGSIYALLINQPEKSWMAALIMQRAQMEYVLRAAFFVRAASEREVARFRRSGKMPKRGKNQIYIFDVANEAAQYLGWDRDRLLSTVKNQYRELSGLVHGGREVLAIYTMHEEWGDIDIDWSELIASVDNILVFAQLGLAVAMSMSPLDPESLDKAVRPAYGVARDYFSGQKDNKGDE